MHVAHVRVVTRSRLVVAIMILAINYDWNFLPCGERRQTDRKKELFRLCGAHSDSSQQE